jgi:hypothetical protein
MQNSRQETVPSLGVVSGTEKVPSLWNVRGQRRGPLSLVSTTEELLDRKVAAPV